MSQCPFNLLQSQSTQPPLGNDDNPNQHMNTNKTQEKDNNQPQYELILELQDSVFQLKGKYKQLVEDYKQFLSHLDKLSKELPQTNNDLYFEDVKKQRQLEEWNKKILDFEGNFLSQTNLSGRKHQLENLEKVIQEYPQETQSKTTPPSVVADRQEDKYKTQLAKEAQEPLQLQSEINKLTELVSNLQKELKAEKEERFNLYKKLEEDKEERSHLQSVIEKLTTLIETKVDLIPNNQNDSPKSNMTPVENAKDSGIQVIQTHESQPQQITSNSSSTYPQFSWVPKYNKDPDSFLQYATEVSATEESINQRRLGTNQSVILENIRKGKGNYWIFTGDNSGNAEKCLVPKGGLKINEYNLKTVQSLFKCTGESLEISSKFILIKPAIVSPIENEKWQVVELGELQFQYNE
jgi:hypothetical protein